MRLEQVVGDRQIRGFAARLPLAKGRVLGVGSRRDRFAVGFLRTVERPERWWLSDRLSTTIGQRDDRYLCHSSVLLTQDMSFNQGRYLVQNQLCYVQLP